jgi:hypothetical protein
VLLVIEDATWWLANKDTPIDSLRWPAADQVVRSSARKPADEARRCPHCGAELNFGPVESEAEDHKKVVEEWNVAAVHFLVNFLRNKENTYGHIREAAEEARIPIGALNEASIRVGIVKRFEDDKQFWFLPERKTE